MKDFLKIFENVSIEKSFNYLCNSFKDEKKGASFYFDTRGTTYGSLTVSSLIRPQLHNFFALFDGRGPSRDVEARRKKDGSSDDLETIYVGCLDRFLDFTDVLQSRPHWYLFFEQEMHREVYHY